MTVRTAQFREYATNDGFAPNTLNTYASFLNKLDQHFQGLDEAIATRGVEAVLAESRIAQNGAFETYASSSRSVLKKYVEFHLQVGAPAEDVEAGPGSQQIEAVAEATGLGFGVEREMQAAVRRQLAILEEGLQEVDGGTELSTIVGRPDVVAVDRNGDLVVIELKAGLCPPGALEQVLGYAQALSEDRSQRVRAFLVAASFSDRTRAAAKRVPDLVLRRYEVALNFRDVG